MKAIKTAATLKKMPLWFTDPKYGHFNNDRSLKQGEIDTLAKWVDTGVAEGDPKDAPAPIQWPQDGWAIENGGPWVPSVEPARSRGAAV